MSNKQKPGKRGKFNGFTIIEVAIAAVVCTIALLGVGFVTIESQRSWARTYSSIYSDIVVQSHVAKKSFESVIRKAKKDTLLINDAGDSIEVSYYSGSGSGNADRYARLYTSNGDLYIEYGKLEPKETTRTNVLCGNVYSCRFQQIGTCVQMTLTLHSSQKNITVATSAVMHN